MEKHTVGAKMFSGSFDELMMDIKVRPTLRTDCIVCSGYVTVVATALATAPIMKTSRDVSLEGKEEKIGCIFYYHASFHPDNVRILLPPSSSPLWKPLSSAASSDLHKS